MKRLIPLILLAAALGARGQGAPVAAEGAWARASVQGQTATGAFMRLTARESVSLVGVASPAAGVAEVHEMKMEGQVMRMRAVAAVPLQPGQALELKPGSYHLMLMDLKAPLKVGTQVPVTLTFRDSKGATSQLQLAVPVLARAPDGAPAHKH